MIDKTNPRYKEHLECLRAAGEYAKQVSGCTKVSVGSCLVTEFGYLRTFGANRAMPNLCKTKGCLRVEKYGDNNKTHRNPDDCRAIHSEIDAISKAAKIGMSVDGATIYVTRYPCEACARAIVAAGIKHVIYGRQQEISELTKQIFEESGVSYDNLSDYDEDDTVN